MRKTDTLCKNSVTEKRRGEPKGEDSGYEEYYLVLYKMKNGDDDVWYLNDISYEGIVECGFERKLGFLVEYYE